jgi:tetratricopeptide (TPR) repeat protein
MRHNHMADRWLAGSGSAAILRAVRKNAILLLFAGLTLTLGAIAYRAYDQDREYARLVAAGDAAVAAGGTFSAIEAYSGAIAVRPDAMLAYLKRGRAYKEQRELEAAARDLRHAAALDPTATLVLELLGDTYLEMGRFDRAAERFATYLTIDDRAARVWYKLGLAHFRAGDTPRALPALERAVTLDGSVAEAHLALGLCLHESGHTARARAVLERTTRLAPGLTAPREALAALYTELDEHPRAIDQLEALVALDPTNADRFIALGEAYSRARRYESGVVALTRALERFPDDARVFAAIGSVWLDAADYRNDRVLLQKAVEALGTAAAHPEASSRTLTLYGRALANAGRLDEAQRALRGAIARSPVEPEAYLQLAALVASTRAVEARDALVRYVALVGERNSSIAKVAADIAEHSLRAGEPDVAVIWIDRAIDAAGETPALARLRARARADRVPH